MAATKGMVQKAREQLGFLERGTEVLKMKRDQLAGEVNKLMRELGRRESAERALLGAYDSAGYAFAVLEAKLEQLAWALMTTNRKVNALEKVVIPRYKELIRYIEEKLNEQALQEFFVTKRMRDLTRVARERSQTSPTS